MNPDFRITIEGYGQTQTILQMSSQGSHRDASAIDQAGALGRLILEMLDRMREGTTQ